jgi:hypothetical protein
MNGRRIGRLAAAVAVLAILVALPATAGATPHRAGAARTVEHNPKGRFLGVIPAGPAKPRLQDSAGRLDYHNGPVMHGETAYTVFWQPPGTYTSPSYRALINTQIADVGAASYGTKNQWSVEEQYYDLSGPGGTKSFQDYNIAFGKSFVDTTKYPANGCTDSDTTVCLSDAQLRSELSSFITAHNLPRGMSNEYFIVTPPNIGSCFSSASTSCAYTQYCAYHSSFGTGSGLTLYANIPYLGNVTGCDQGHYPNGSFGDPTVSALSHEQRETMTDPLGTGWWDSNTGDEGSDKCNQDFGTALGSTGATDDPVFGFPNGDSDYNQIINGDYYAVQREWSNRDLACLQKNSNGAPTGVTFTHGTAAHGVATSFTGAGTDPDGVYHYKWFWGDGTTTETASATTTHTFATAGTKKVGLVVFDQKGSQTRKVISVTVS